MKQKVKRFLKKIPFLRYIVVTIRTIKDKQRRSILLKLNSILLKLNSIIIKYDYGLKKLSSLYYYIQITRSPADNYNTLFDLLTPYNVDGITKQRFGRTEDGGSYR